MHTLKKYLLCHKARQHVRDITISSSVPAHSFVIVILLSTGTVLICFEFVGCPVVHLFTYCVIVRDIFEPFREVFLLLPINVDCWAFLCY